MTKTEQDYIDRLNTGWMGDLNPIQVRDDNKLYEEYITMLSKYIRIEKEEV